MEPALTPAASTPAHDHNPGECPLRRISYYRTLQQQDGAREGIAHPRLCEEAEVEWDVTGPAETRQDRHRAVGCRDAQSEEPACAPVILSTPAGRVLCRRFSGFEMESMMTVDPTPNRRGTSRSWDVLQETKEVIEQVGSTGTEVQIAWGRAQRGCAELKNVIQMGAERKIAVFCFVLSSDSINPGAEAMEPALTPAASTPAHDHNPGECPLRRISYYRTLQQQDGAREGIAHPRLCEEAEVGSWADRSPLHEAASQGRLLALKTLLSQINRNTAAQKEQTKKWRQELGLPDPEPTELELLLQKWEQAEEAWLSAAPAREAPESPAPEVLQGEQEEETVPEPEEVSTTPPPQLQTTTPEEDPALVSAVPCPLLLDTLPVFLDLPAFGLEPRNLHHQPQLCPWFPTPLSPNTQTSLGCCQTSLMLPLFAAKLPLGDRTSLHRSPGEDLCPLLHSPVPRLSLQSPLSSRWGPKSQFQGPVLEAPEEPTHPQARPCKRVKIDICGLEGMSECVAALISWGADVDQTIPHLGTPLYVACISQQLHCTQKLLDGGANVQKGKFLETPLHAAAQQNSPEVVKLLLDFGADINVKNLDLKRPVEAAAPSSLVEKYIYIYILFMVFVVPSWGRYK
ncbi:UNVERIFIED_CONTAM: hypothetical protein FKN15_057124 [Acipenser sinensis]